MVAKLSVKYLRYLLLDVWRVQGCSGLFATVRGVRANSKANATTFRELRDELMHHFGFPLIAGCRILLSDSQSARRSGQFFIDFNFDL